MRAINQPYNDANRAAFDLYLKGDLSACQAKTKQGLFNCLTDAILTAENLLLE